MGDEEARAVRTQPSVKRDAGMPEDDDPNDRIGVHRRVDRKACLGLGRDGLEDRFLDVEGARDCILEPVVHADARDDLGRVLIEAGSRSSSRLRLAQSRTRSLTSAEGS